MAPFNLQAALAGAREAEFAMARCFMGASPQPDEAGQARNYGPDISTLVKMIEAGAL